MHQVRSQKLSGSVRRLLPAVVFAAGLLPVVRTADAQPSPRLSFGGEFIIGVPVGEFSEQLDDTGYGASFHGIYALGESPIHLGGEFGFAIYGTDSHQELFTSPTHAIVLRVSTTNSILLSHAFVRVQPRHGHVRPYVDGLVGVKYLVTTTSFSGDDSSDTYDSQVDFDDTAFSYGIGGGVHILLAGADGGPFELLLDVGARYLRGGQAEYLREDSIRYEGDAVIYEVYSSNTDMFVPKFGVTFRF